MRLCLVSGFPHKIVLWCQEAPQNGGEWPLGDGRSHPHSTTSHIALPTPVNTSNTAKHHESALRDCFVCFDSVGSHRAILRELDPEVVEKMERLQVACRDPTRSDMV